MRCKEICATRDRCCKDYRKRILTFPHDPRVTAVDTGECGACHFHPSVFPGGFAPADPRRAHSRGPQIPTPFARVRGRSRVLSRARRAVRLLRLVVAAIPRFALARAVTRLRGVNAIRVVLLMLRQVVRPVRSIRLQTNLELVFQAHGGFLLSSTGWGHGRYCRSRARGKALGNKDLLRRVQGNHARIFRVFPSPNQARHSQHGLVLATAARELDANRKASGVRSAGHRDCRRACGVDTATCCEG